MRARNSKTPDINTENFNLQFSGPQFFTKLNLKKHFDGCFNIDYVKNDDNSDLSYSINQTMMRINLPKPLAPGSIFKFKN